MATTASALPPAASPRSDKRAERRFFSIYLAAIATVIFAGFTPSFFLRGMIELPRPLPPLRPDLLVHGLVATAFVLFFPLQAWLIATGRRALHMKLGKWGFALGALMAAMLYVVAIGNFRSAPPQFGAAAAEGPLLTLPVVALLLYLAWRLRFNAQAHKRLMVAVAWTAFFPGAGRLLGWLGAPLSPLFALAVPLALFAPLWIWDIASRRRPHWATVAGTVAILGTQIGHGVILASAWWPGFLAALPGFGGP